MGVRHQGIAASLMPGESVRLPQLLAAARRCRSRARRAIAGPIARRSRRRSSAPRTSIACAGCARSVARARRSPRRSIAAARSSIAPRPASCRANDWQAPHHAALLIAFAHLDVGRIAEAIELADDAMSRSCPTTPPTQEAFAWAQKRIAHWKTDAGLLARAYAWEGHHRGDPGRVIVGLTRGRITDDEDAMMLIEALVAIGRDEQAEIAYWQCAGHRRQRRARRRQGAARRREGADPRRQPRRGARPDPDRRSSAAARAGSRPRSTGCSGSRRSGRASEWERVIERRLERGAITLAQMAARDLADFVPGHRHAARATRARRAARRSRSIRCGSPS